jgi:hypothetical protein
LRLSYGSPGLAQPVYIGGEKSQKFPLRVLLPRVVAVLLLGIDIDRQGKLLWRRHLAA